MKYIINKTIKGPLYITEQDKLKLNANCPASEKTIGEHPCGGSEKKQYTPNQSARFSPIPLDEKTLKVSHEIYKKVPDMDGFVAENAVNTYVFGLEGMKSNEYLRHLEPGANIQRDWVIKLTTDVINQSKLPTDTVLYRAVSPNAWNVLPKQLGDEYIEKAFCSTTRDLEIAKRISKKGVLLDRQEGTTLYLIEIRAHKGTLALPLDIDDPNEPNEPQKEVIIQRSHTFRVLGKEQDGKYTKLIVETVPEKNILINDPTKEDAKLVTQYKSKYEEDEEDEYE